MILLFTGAGVIMVIALALWINVIRDPDVRAYNNRYRKNIRR